MGMTGFVSICGEKTQADYLTEVYNQSKAQTWMEGVWWFSLYDFTNKNGAKHWGLTRTDDSQKPAFDAFKLQ